MRHLLRLSLAIMLSSCANQGYQANSVEEARAYSKRAVQTGVIHAGGEQELFLRKSSGKPSDGKWNPDKVERFVSKWVADNPKRAEINLAATSGTISERERLHLISVLDMSEAADQQQKAAAMQTMAAGLNSSAASMNQSAAAMNQSAALYRQPTRRIDLQPTYGGGYTGTIR